MNTTDMERCRYHAGKRARWHCKACELALCETCKPMAELLPYDVVCPLCAEPMTDTQVGAMFWHDPRPALRYPLHPVILVLIGVLAVVSAIVPRGLPALLAAIPALAVFAIFAYVVFDQSSRGEEGLPGIREMLDEDRLTAFPDFAKTILIYALLPVLAWMSGSLLLFSLVLAATCLVFPAALMAVAIDERLNAAADPARIGRLINTLGTPYYILAGTTAVIAVAPFALVHPAGGLLPDPVHAGILTLLYGYLILLAFRLVGDVLFIFRRRLDFAAGIDRIDRPRKPRPEEYEPALALADARIQIGEGHARRARMTVGQALTHHSAHPGLNECFDELIHVTGSEAEFRNHIERRLRRLVSNGQPAAAAELWQNNRKHLGSWLPRIAETRHRLALELEQRGEQRVAIRLLLKLPSTDPRYVELPEACLEAARMLETHLGDSSQADKLRTWVINRFPDRAQQWHQDQKEVAKQSG